MIDRFTCWTCHKTKLKRMKRTSITRISWWVYVAGAPWPDIPWHSHQYNARYCSGIPSLSYLSSGLHNVQNLVAIHTKWLSLLFAIEVLGVWRILWSCTCCSFVHARSHWCAESVRVQILRKRISTEIMKSTKVQTLGVYTCICTSAIYSLATEEVGRLRNHHVTTPYTERN